MTKTKQNRTKPNQIQHKPILKINPKPNQHHTKTQPTRPTQNPTPQNTQNNNGGGGKNASSALCTILFHRRVRDVFFSPSRRQRDRRTSTGWGSRCSRGRTTAIPIPTASTPLPTSVRSPRSPIPSVEPGRQATLSSGWG